MERSYWIDLVFIASPTFLEIRRTFLVFPSTHSLHAWTKHYSFTSISSTAAADDVNLVEPFIGSQFKFPNNSISFICNNNNPTVQLFSSHDLLHLPSIWVSLGHHHHHHLLDIPFSQWTVNNSCKSNSIERNLLYSVHTAEKRNSCKIVSSNQVLRFPTRRDKKMIFSNSNKPHIVDGHYWVLLIERD